MPRIPCSLTLLAAAMAAIVFPACAHAAAEKAADKADAPIQKVEVKGAADAYNPRRDDTATKIVVTNAEIVKYGDTNVLDVLKRVPGVTVVSSGGRGGEVRMRGLGGGYTQILVDGEKAPAGFSIESLAPDSIERIEVLRAATAEFSTQSIAGTINIVLRKAIRTAQRELKLRMGWSETSKPRPGMNLQLSDRAGKLAYSLGFNADSFHFANQALHLTENRDPSGAVSGSRVTISRQAEQFRGFSLTPRLTWTFANGDTLTSQSGADFRSNRGVRDEDTETLHGPLPTYAFIDTSSASRWQALRSELNWVHKIAGGAKLDMKISGSSSRSYPGSQRLAYAQRHGALFLVRIDGGAGREAGGSTSGKYSAPLGQGHSLMAGWDWSESNRRSVSTVDQRIFPIDELLHTSDSFKAQLRRYAAFAQDEWKVSEQWSVYGGLRWEGSSTRVEGSGYSPSTSHTGVWSPVFQTLYKIPGRSGDQLRLALTRTYKAPSASSLIPIRNLTLNNSRDEPDYVGNPRLKPEIALGVDASYEHYWSEGAMLSVSASAREIDGFTSFVNALGADGRWVVMNLNSGKAHTRGIELEAKFPLKALMATAHEVDVRANLSRNWSSIDSLAEPYNRISRQPPLSASFGVDYKKGRLTTGASASYQQGGTWQVSNTERMVTPDTYSADMYALWKIEPKTQLRVSVGNLFQKDYAMRQEHLDAFGAGLRSSRYPVSPNVRLALELKH